MRHRGPSKLHGAGRALLKDRKTRRRGDGGREARGGAKTGSRYWRGCQSGKQGSAWSLLEGVEVCATFTKHFPAQFSPQGSQKNWTVRQSSWCPRHGSLGEVLASPHFLQQRRRLVLIVAPFTDQETKASAVAAQVHRANPWPSPHSNPGPRAQL